MSNVFIPFLSLTEKRQRAGAVQDASRYIAAFLGASASWTAAALCRFWIVALVLVATHAFAIDPATDFNSANELYAKGQFADAAAAYEKILATGPVSANLLFNDGNAEFKAGNPGKAIAAFRKAELLAPRDSEIRANLAFVRSQAGGSPEGLADRLSDLLGQLTLNEWTMVATVLFWSTLMLLAVKQVRPVLAPRLKTAVTGLAALTVLTASIAGVRTAEHFSKRTAVVVQSQVKALSGPFEDAQVSFAVRDGAELPVLDRHGDWVQVADRGGKVGWLPAKLVEVLPDA
jgi:tetratricopeptide (TPR) repeat protein